MASNAPSASTEQASIKLEPDAPSELVEHASIKSEPDAPPEFVEYASIKFEPDAYQAVLHAAFGGVMLELPSLTRDELEKVDDESKAERKLRVRIHPAALLPVAIGLFYVQATCLSIFVLDMDLGNSFIAETWEEFGKSPVEQRTLITKCIMAVVLQLSCMREFEIALTSLSFVLNPVSWLELKQPKEPWFMSMIRAPLCVIASFMQVVIAYYVTRVSTSVILNASSASDAVYDSLALTFIVQLDELFWQVTTMILHIDQVHYENHKLKVRNLAKEPLIRKWIPQWCPSLQPWFRTGYGGKFKILQNCVIYIIISLMYVVSLGGFLLAIQTQVLPMARDVCALYRGAQGLDGIARCMFWVIDFFTMYSFYEHVDDAVRQANLDNEEGCVSEKYDITLGNLFVVAETFPHVLAISLGAIVIFIIAPQLMYCNFREILKSIHWLGHSESSETESTAIYEVAETPDTPGKVYPMLLSSRSASAENEKIPLISQRSAARGSWRE